MKSRSIAGGETPEHQEAICELELELLWQDGGCAGARPSSAGNRRAAPGSLSKAARGYHLAQGNEARPVQQFGVLQVAPKASVEQGLEASLENALAHWLYHDEVWSRGNPMAKGEILRAIARVRHALVLFGGIVPRKATAQLREQLAEAEAVLTEAGKDPSALFSIAAVSAKLALTEWLVSRSWRAF